jgi:DNA-binding response OmpR family regulator
MPGDGSPATVLVVDDNEPIADTYTAFLSDTYAVRTAYDGSEALDMLDTEVDVVLLDRRMPGISGDEVLEQIETRSLDCRVVMLTAVDPEFDIVDMPFDQYVVKPVERDELNDVVEEMRERSGYDDEFRQFLALVSKKATLENEKGSGELETNEQYDHVKQRLQEKRDELVIDTDDIEGLFTDELPDIAPEDLDRTNGDDETDHE